MKPLGIPPAPLGTKSNVILIYHPLLFPTVRIYSILAISVINYSAISDPCYISSVFQLSSERSQALKFRTCGSYCHVMVKTCDFYYSPWRLSERFMLDLATFDWPCWWAHFSLTSALTVISLVVARVVLIKMMYKSSHLSDPTSSPRIARAVFNSEPRELMITEFLSPEYNLRALGQGY